MNISLKKLYLQLRKANLFVNIIRSICVAVLISNSANAAVWLFDPKITFSYEYDDNYRLATDSSNEDEVSTTKLSGELALKGKSERLDLKALLDLDATNYSGDDDELSDRNNQSFRLTTAYRATERNRVSLKANIFRDTILRTTRSFSIPDEDELTFDPNQDIDENLVRENVRRTRYLISPGWNYRLSEKTSIGLQYSYRDLSFSGERDSGLVESDSQSIIARINRKLTEKDRITASISERYFRPDNDRDVDTLEVKIGWVHKFTETFAMDFSVGARDSDFDNAPKSSDSGFVGNIGATKRSDRTVYRVNLEQRENPSSSGNTVETDRLRMGVEHALTEKLTFSFDGNFFDTETNNSVDSDSNREYFSLEPGLSWKFLPSWELGASYRYADEDLDDGGSADSNAAFINLSWSPPRQF